MWEPLFFLELRSGFGQEAPPAEDLPPVPRGVEVLARGPVHEAFAPLTDDPVPTKPVPKKPPAPVAEMPPAEKPDGNVIWIGGYWAWDDDRSDFLWVSGVWRTPPPGKKWVAGYWREGTAGCQWVPGFWTAAEDKPAQNVAYYPPPPPPPQVAPPGNPPAPDTFFVPGTYQWADGQYGWQAGYWARVQPGYVWVPAHYRWTPGGCIFIPGYWDLALSRRGVLYAPVIIDTNVVGVNYVHTPTYVVNDTMVVESLFVRPTHCHYYFGDYYGPAYANLGFESCVVYSRRRYDSIIAYECWQRRAQPGWLNLQINLYHDRCAGRVICPPRTLMQENLIVRGGGVVVTTRFLVTPHQLAAARGTRLVVVDLGMRQQIREHAVGVQRVSLQRHEMERGIPPISNRPHVTAMPIHDVRPVGHGAAPLAHPGALPHGPVGHPVPHPPGKPAPRGKEAHER